MEPVNPLAQAEAAERFVLGQMQGRELDEYLADMLLNPAIRDEIAAARLRIKAARGFDAQTLPNRRPYRRYRWWLTGVLVLGAALLAWRYFMATEAPIRTPVPENTQPNMPALPNTSDTLPLPDVDPSAPSRSMPIAANLKPNPALEYLIDAGGYRSTAPDGFQWVVPPDQQSVLARQKNGQTRLLLEAVARATPEQINALQWQLFSNNPKAYEAGQSLYTGAFSIQSAKNDTFQLLVRKQVDLAPGLYYYLIEDRHSGQVYYAGKRVVRP
ncbi:MAG: hypothetical protein SFV52_12225 [Saprospiraceae bacterium]|nr:hypothetical protein [Saprospiraceae bacterium]